MHLFRRPADLQLDDRVLPADDVGAAVQQPRGRDSAGRGAVDLRVFGVEGVAHPHLGDDRQRRLVDAAADAEVRVRIDDPRHDEHARRVDHLDPRRRYEVGADGADLAAAHQDVGAGEVLAGRGENRRVTDQNVAARLERRTTVGLRLGPEPLDGLQRRGECANRVAGDRA